VDVKAGNTCYALNSKLGGKKMESFEEVVATALEAENYVVTGPITIKWFSPGHPKKKGEQPNRLEIDLVAARGDRLVLATVKSFFGSGGVFPNDVMGTGRGASGYTMINDKKKRAELIERVADKYGYEVKDVEVRLYAGKFAGVQGEQIIRDWASKQVLGGGVLQVVNALQLSKVIFALAKESHYQNKVAIAFAKTQIEAELIQSREDKAKLREAKIVKAKPSTAGKTVMTARQAEELFPLGSKAESTRDGFSGIVIGYTQQHSSQPYVTIYDSEKDISKRRVVHSLKRVD
jgi:hypothetical protein